VTLEDLYEKPIAGDRCVLSLEGDIRNLTTDGKGGFEQVIPPDTHTQFAIQIGSLIQWTWFRARSPCSRSWGIAREM
jgi:hypothetical protein